MPTGDYWLDATIHETSFENGRTGYVIIPRTECGIPSFILCTDTEACRAATFADGESALTAWSELEEAAGNIPWSRINVLAAYSYK